MGKPDRLPCMGKTVNKAFVSISISEENVNPDWKGTSGYYFVLVLSLCPGIAAEQPLCPVSGEIQQGPLHKNGNH